VLVAWGSKWAPCMREDATVLEFSEATIAEEKNYGCCLNTNTNECGQMAADTCNGFSGTFHLGQSCASTVGCASTILHPCCFGILGQCALLTESHCDVISGLYDPTAELCSNNDCIFKQCGMFQEKSKLIARKTHPNQFWRFITAVFLHVGVIHFVLNALGQYVLVSGIEFVAGPWRTAFMYIMSGAGGFLISALFSADTLSNGSSGAIYGMLGVETIDLFQTWQLLDNKPAQLVGLLIKLVIFLGIGTLPYIDNFAHVGGFVSGIVAALWVMPYIMFNTVDMWRKRIVHVVAGVLFVVLCVGLLYKFYTDNRIVCSWCNYIDCVPYTPSICAVS